MVLKEKNLNKEMESLRPYIGLDMMEIMQNEKIPVSALHYLRKICSLSPKEAAAYEARCRIENSYVVMSSERIKDSSYIINSTDVRNSEYIFGSNSIYDAGHVYNSTDVVFAQFVTNSEKVTNASKIIGSKNVTNSVQILESSDIFLSTNIFKSTSIHESDYIYISNNLDKSAFCGFCTDCARCLFCTNLHDANCYIFNKEVDYKTFERVYEELQIQLSAEFSEFISVRKIDNQHAQDEFVYSSRIDGIFEGLSTKFFDWVKSLPQYSDFDFSLLFFK